MSIELLQASTHGDITAVLALLDAAGVDLEARLNGVGWTALMFAAADGHDEVVRLLLGAGADVDGQSENGLTALILAAVNGHAATVRVLLDVGADFDIQTENNVTALMGAAGGAHLEVVRLLLGAGADIHLGGHAAVVRLYNMVPVTPSVSDARATLTV